jgi:hypothetical protein
MDWAPGEQTEGGSEGAWGRRVTARAGSSAGGDGPHLGTRDERLGEQGGWSSAMEGLRQGAAGRWRERRRAAGKSLAGRGDKHRRPGFLRAEAAQGITPARYF